MNATKPSGPAPEVDAISRTLQEVDAVDQAVIALIAKRQALIERVVALQHGSGARPSERFFTMLKARRRWAKEAGLDPERVEMVFNVLVQGSLERLLSQRGDAGRQFGFWHRPDAHGA